MEKLKIAIVGCGNFARHFVPLFKTHPYVEKVYCCDLINERANEYSEKFEIEIIPTFEECLASDKINCVAIFTERHTHGPFAIAALNAGKDVY